MFYLRSVRGCGYHVLCPYETNVWSGNETNGGVSLASRIREFIFREDRVMASLSVTRALLRRATRLHGRVAPPRVGKEARATVGAIF